MVVIIATTLYIPIVICLDWIFRNFISVIYNSDSKGVNNNLFQSKVVEFDNELLETSSTLDTDISDALNEVTLFKQNYINEHFRGLITI